VQQKLDAEKCGRKHRFETKRYYERMRHGTVFPIIGRENAREDVSYVWGKKFQSYIIKMFIIEKVERRE
jgi:hypothetical protein